jgi:phenolic acid decarboxylase
MKVMNGYIKVNRWIELSSEDIFIMRLDRILTMSESKDAKLIAIYDNFVEDDQGETTINVSQSNGEVEITNTMGYISSVEDARNKFEEIFKINQGPKDS